DQVIGLDNYPVALADRRGGPGGEVSECRDLDPAGDAFPASGRDLDRQPELDAIGPVASGEGTRVIAEAAGDSDLDRIHDLLPGAVAREGRPSRWRPGAAVPFPAVRCQRRRAGVRNRLSRAGQDVSPAGAARGFRERSLS